MSRLPREGPRETVLAGRFSRDFFVGKLFGNLSGPLLGPLSRKPREDVIPIRFMRDGCRGRVCAGRFPPKSRRNLFGKCGGRSLEEALENILVKSLGGRFTRNGSVGKLSRGTFLGEWFSREGSRGTVLAGKNSLGNFSEVFWRNDSCGMVLSAFFFAWKFL